MNYKETLAKKNNQMQELTNALENLTLDNHAQLIIFLSILKQHVDYAEEYVYDTCFLRHTRRYLKSICWDADAPMYADLSAEHKEVLTDLYILAERIVYHQSRSVADFVTLFQGILGLVEG
jgi:hypothetical protein